MQTFGDKTPVSGRESGPGCHPERSEGSGSPHAQILRFAQDDKPYLQMSADYVLRLLFLGFHSIIKTSESIYTTSERIFRTYRIDNPIKQDATTTGKRHQAMELHELIQTVTSYSSSSEAKSVLTTAFQIASDAHDGFQRINGEPYLNHYNNS